MSTKSNRMPLPLALFAAAALSGPAALGAFKPVPHPFILWTAEEGARIRARIESQDWARREFDSLAKEKSGECVANLLRFSVMGDAEAGRKEKDYLLSFVGAKVDPRPWSDNYLTALRYDVLYGDLTPEQRAGIEDTFRRHIAFEVSQDRKVYTRLSWLPNMQWCRKMSVGLMAVAMQDEASIRALFAGNGGWKYYFDDYVSDGRFYNEEFGKQYSMNGEMLLWCRGLERLGLNDLGYGYTGAPAAGSGRTAGANLRNYLESYLRITYPRIDLGTSRPMYGHMSMGDAKGPPRGFSAYPFQQCLVAGYLTDDTGGSRRWSANNMNGRDHKDRIIDKLHAPLWFEIAHAKWPDAGFDWVLAQMRAPGQDRYYPSLFFGLDPVDPAAAQPPPAPSGAYPERGIAMLRADESPAYWESPAPALGLRWGTEYVHNARDAFSIAGFYAFNRPIYVNRQVSPGYAGTDPTWSAAARGHSTVMVDALEPEFVGEIPLRRHFTPLAKYCAGRGTGVYPGVTQTRSVVLTREYFVDLFRLSSDTARSYFYQVQTLGHACPDNPSEWAATRHLVGLSPDVQDEQSCVVHDRPWAITVLQSTAGADPRYSGLGESWFRNRVGVRITMLGEPGTIAYTGWGPAMTSVRDRLNYGAEEPGGRVVAAARTKPATTFVSLHEPFRNGPCQVADVARLAEAQDAVALRATGTTGSPVNDRVLLSYGTDTNRLVTLAGDGESFAFADYAFIRIAPGRVEAVGRLNGCLLRLPDAAAKPAFTLNGKPAKADVRDGVLRFGDLDSGLAAATAPLPAAPPRAGPLAARWFPERLNLATGGEGRAMLTVRNNGLTPLTTTIALATGATNTLTVEPATVAVSDLPPGVEKQIAVRVKALPGGANRAVDVVTRGDEVPTQQAALRVAQGVCIERGQFWPREIGTTVYAPRYTLKYYHLNSCGAALVLDPAGTRRFGTKGELYPTLRALKGEPGTNGLPAETWSDVKLTSLMYWNPVLRRPSGAPAYAIESGTHPHQPEGVALEYRWTEDWVVTWYRFAARRIEVTWRTDRGVVTPLAEKASPSALLVHTGAGAVDATAAEGKPVRAVFQKPAGQEYGEAMFYPTNSVLTGRDGSVVRVASPADQPVAFTFCREDEFPALAQRWIQGPSPERASARGQGDME